VFVDDGSTDGSLAELQALAAEDPRMVVIRLQRNFGQTAALAAAIDHARGDILVPLDGDGQNDPADIPRLVAELDRGFDIVSGWRRDRKDLLLTRRLPSWAANRLITLWTGVRLHDLGCSLKAYRAPTLRGVRLFGEMHRLLPIYASRSGARIGELVVNHRPRRCGVSKYGLERLFKVALDLLTYKLMGRYATKPIYLFGGVGLLVVFAGVLAGVLFVLAGVGLAAGVGSPLLLWAGLGFGLLTVVVALGGVMIMLGLIAELIVRTSYEAQGKKIYELAGGHAVDAAGARVDGEG
jgi:glycosyltransferase involved in cell wall biosynthesis